MNKFDAPQWLQLNKGGAVARLSMLRAIAIQSNATRPPSTQIDWRKARSSGFDNWAERYASLDQGFNTKTDYRFGVTTETKTPVWYCHTGAQFRNECDAHELEGVRMDHTGWYADPDGDNLYVAIVGQLSHGRYIAGYRMTGNDERVYFGDVYTEAKEAAYAGDNEARIDAEKECEYQERWQAAQALDSEIADQKRDVGRMFKLRHTDGFDSASDYRELNDTIADLRNNMNTMDEQFSEFKGEF